MTSPSVAARCSVAGGTRLQGGATLLDSGLTSSAPLTVKAGQASFVGGAAVRKGLGVTQGAVAILVGTDGALAGRRAARHLH